MEFVGKGKDVQLKLALTNTDLIDIFRETKQLPDSSKFTNKKTAKSDVLACYSTGKGALTLTGILHRRFPVSISLKPGSRTYANVIKFLLRELKQIRRSAEQRKNISKSNDYETVMAGLTSSLEEKLLELDREALAAVGDITDIVELFTSDFEQPKNQALQKVTSEIQDIKAKAISANYSGRSVVRDFFPRQRQFRLFSDTRKRMPQLISGFLSLEIQEYSKSEQEQTDIVEQGIIACPEDVLEEIRTSLVFKTPPSVMVRGVLGEVNFSMNLSKHLLKQVELLLHWGRIDGCLDKNCQWQDEEISFDEISRKEDGSIEVTKKIRLYEQGRYGLTCAVVHTASGQRFWANDFGSKDTEFELLSDPAQMLALRKIDVVENIDIKGKLLQSLASFEQFVRTLSTASKSPDIRGVGKLLLDISKYSYPLRSLISSYYHQVTRELESSHTVLSKPKLKKVLGILKNIGIGEVVFIAPEGPHAIAGGLAQVIVGLTKSLSRCGVSCSVITPLYEEEQGNKHTSAQKLLTQGVQILGKHVPIRKIGSVKIPFGPTKSKMDDTVVQFPRIVSAGVYLAENEGVRIFFLRHPRWANRLYASGWADDQVRRALFLSRGALEIVRDRRFNVLPHIMVTNDWPTALVPALLKSDPLYAEDPRLKEVECMHIMHNCGRDYQGRFITTQFGEDLYPLLGLSGEHYFGLSDPLDRSAMNFTAAAVFHCSKALVAVSKPYARQLLTRRGGEGLYSLFAQQSKVLFGVSNGVDLGALRDIFWQLGETARNSLGLEPLIKKNANPIRLIKKLPDYKLATKLVVQEKCGLSQDENSILISLIGRIAEQKGISLLSGQANGEQVSLLESLLVTYPKVQILIGGPPTNGDTCFHELETVVSDLEKRFSGRIKAIFDFIPHRDALEITQGSDIFLMPSRYEPGGITQLEAMATGTLVVARNVGGIAATLVDYCPFKDEGNSFLFKDYSSLALKEAISRSIAVVNDSQKHNALIKRVAGAESDWSYRVPKYLSIFQHVAGVFDSKKSFEYLDQRWNLLNSLRPAL